MDPSCIAKHSIETSSRRCFCFIVSKRDTYLAHSFLMRRFSVNMRCIALFEMPTMSASSRTFSQRSSNTILWIFLTISVVVTSFGRPQRCSSWQFVQLRLDSDAQTLLLWMKKTPSKYWIVPEVIADFFIQITRKKMNCQLGHLESQTDYI